MGGSGGSGAYRGGDSVPPPLLRFDQHHDVEGALPVDVLLRQDQLLDLQIVHAMARMCSE